MKTIYFVRHGLSEANVAGIASGGEHQSELTDAGREQARQAGRNLKDKNIDTIVCSPMTRTIETAQLIAKEIGYDVDKIRANNAFIERYMGEYSGRPHAEYRKVVTSGVLPPDMEKPEEMIKRIKQGLDWVRSLDGENIVLVAHGATGRIIQLIQENLHIDDMYKLAGFANTEIYEFTLD